MVQHGVHVYDWPFEPMHVTVDMGPCAFDPTSVASVALKVLARKRSRAVKTYERTHPLWLAMTVTDQRGVFGASMALLSRVQVDIAPFERVVFSVEGRALVWDSGELPVAI